MYAVAAPGRVYATYARRCGAAARKLLSLICAARVAHYGRLRLQRRPGPDAWFNRVRKLRDRTMRATVCEACCEVCFEACMVRVKRMLHAASLKPWRLSRWVGGADGVLELPSGTLLRTQTQVGDRVEIQN